MAKFAELTATNGKGRALINPELVAHFSRRADGTSTVTFADGTWMAVDEEPAEVLRRLCYPAMPEPPADELMELDEIVRKIGAFRILCEEGESTDTGAAWELLDEIEDTLKPMVGRDA